MDSVQKNQENVQSKVNSMLKGSSFGIMSGRRASLRRLTQEKSRRAFVFGVKKSLTLDMSAGTNN